MPMPGRNPGNSRNGMARSSWGLVLEDEAPDWRTRAACGPANADLFQVASRGRKVLTLTADNLAAIAICNGCPVQSACDADARADDEERLDANGRAKDLVPRIAGGNVHGTGGRPVREARQGVARDPAAARRRGPAATHPCGTVAAATRHRRAKEPLCAPCRDAERTFRTEQQRKRRHRRYEAAS